METIQKNWSDFKSLIITIKQLKYQETSTNDYYQLFATENGTTYNCDIEKGTADATDYENNYQNEADEPILLGEDNVMDALAIRDVNDHLTLISDNRGFIPKTIVIYNNTDQIVTIQVEGDRDRDFNVAMNVGNSFTISSTTHNYVTLNDYLPFLRAKINFNTAPTTGDVSVFFLKTRGS